MKELVDYSVHSILDVILRHNATSYTYIILGDAKTGKTWLRNELINRGFVAFDISEEICDFVKYKGSHNYCLIDEFKKHAVIVLNKPLDI